MLMFRISEIAKHVRRRSKKNEAPTFVEQDRLMKHLENFRAGLMNRNNDDFVVRHAPNNFHDVLGILCGKARSRFVKKVDVRHAKHIGSNIEAFSLAAAQRFLLRTADHCIPAFAESKLD